MWYQTEVPTRKRKLYTNVYRNLEIQNLDGLTIDQLIEELTEYKENVIAQGYEDAVIETELDWENPECCVIGFQGVKTESDEMFQARVDSAIAYNAKAKVESARLKEEREASRDRLQAARDEQKRAESAKWDKIRGNK